MLLHLVVYKEDEQIRIGEASNDNWKINFFYKFRKIL